MATKTNESAAPGVVGRKKKDERYECARCPDTRCKLVVHTPSGPSYYPPMFCPFSGYHITRKDIAPNGGAHVWRGASE